MTSATRVAADSVIATPRADTMPEHLAEVTTALGLALGWLPPQSYLTTGLPEPQ